MLKLEQRLRFDLTHSLAGHAEVTADLVKRVLATGVTKPKRIFRTFSSRGVRCMNASLIASRKSALINSWPKRRPIVFDQFAKTDILVRSPPASRVRLAPAQPRAPCVLEPLEHQASWRCPP